MASFNNLNEDKMKNPCNATTLLVSRSNFSKSLAFYIKKVIGKFKIWGK